MFQAYQSNRLNEAISKDYFTEILKNCISIVTAINDVRGIVDWGEGVISL